MHTIHTRNIRRLYNECFNQGVLDAVDEVIAPSFVVNGAAMGQDGFRKLVAELRAGFAELHFVLNDVLPAEDRVVVRWTMTGTHRGRYQGVAPTGKSVVLSAIAIYRMVDGRCVDQSSIVDRLALLQQLGVTTVPSAGAPPVESRA